MMSNFNEEEAGDDVAAYIQVSGDFIFIFLGIRTIRIQL